MDYSQYQVKYIENPTFVSKIPELESYEPISISNLQIDNAEPLPSTQLIMQEEEQPQKANPVKRVIKQSKLPDLPKSQRLANFNLAYDQALKSDTTGQLASRRNLLTRLAYQESGFRHNIGNSRGVPAFGYFQFMQGNYRGKNYNNIGQYAGVDLNTFRNSPVLQIQAANNLANYFMNSFSKTEIQRLHQMGYSDSAIIAGAWLGGPGGVRAFAFKNQDRKDANGTGVSTYMKKFNNL